MYKSVRDVICSLVSESSLHGLPKILSSKHWYQRLLWICLVLITFGFLVFQLNHLFCEYKRYPIKTKVSMKRATLPFPAISFCNINPLKKSRMYLIEGTELYDYVLRKSWSDNNHESKQEYNVYSSGSRDQYNYYENYLDNPKNTNENGSTDKSWVENDSYQEYDDTFYDPLDEYDMFPHETSSESAWSDFIGFMDEQQDLKDDPRSEDIKKFMGLFQNETKSNRQKLGHSITDLLINCSFNGKTCSARDFTLFQTLDFGNCYTLSSDSFRSRRTGPLNGLQIVLQLETFEHTEAFLDGSGVRIAIHEPGTLPFPADEGFTLSPGYETSIGMKMVSLSRTESPYGNCMNAGEFYQKYGVRYTVTTCINLCRNTKVIDICKCRPSENIVDIDYMDQFADLPVCSLAGKTNRTNRYDVCEEYVFYQIEEGFINCICESACSETVYKSTLSGRVWPRKSYLDDELLGNACSIKNYSYCQEKMKQPNLYFNDNFLKFVIYYEDLNFEEISEEPLYDVFRFLSDIGGALGLFLGASVLSFVEIVQLMVEILNYFRHKCLKDKIDLERPICVFVKPTKKS